MGLPPKGLNEAILYMAFFYGTSTSIGPTSMGFLSIGPTSMGFPSIGPTYMVFPSIGPSFMGLPTHA
jgi:hypothetical protein